jgi:hypothetical protein
MVTTRNSSPLTTLLRTRYLMKQMADYTYNDRFPYRMRENIVDYLSRNVCLCDHPSGLKQSSVIRTAHVCKDCNKFPVYYVYKCIICEVEFLHDFISNFCYVDPCCWDCNPQNEKCTEHLYCVTYIKDEDREPPTVVLKPAFTKEQLDSVFDF